MRQVIDTALLMYVMCTSLHNEIKKYLKEHLNFHSLYWSSYAECKKLTATYGLFCHAVFNLAMFDFTGN